MPDTGAAPSRRVRVERVMGTAVGVDLRDADVADAALDAFFAWLQEVDARFSTYRDDSAVSRIRRGELSPQDAGRDMTEVLALCEEVCRRSGGAFDAWRCSADGLDPSGLVKGWSVQRGLEMLLQAGARNLCVNAGGDVVVRGVPEPGRAWRVGLRHPEDAAGLTAVIEVHDAAVATSGAYERGAHIRDPRTGGEVRELLSLTVVGPSLTLADAYATAAFVMGVEGVAWVAARSGYEAYAVATGGRRLWTEGFGALLRDPG